MSFHDNLKRYRELAGYSQAKDFADALGIKYTTYIAYEQGREPKYELLCSIAKKLSVSIDNLLDFKTNSIQDARFNELSSFFSRNLNGKLTIEPDNNFIIGYIPVNEKLSFGKPLSFKANKAALLDFFDTWKNDYTDAAASTFLSDLFFITTATENKIIKFWKIDGKITE